MLQAYENITRNLPKFSWDQDLHSAAEQFILTRECFFYPPNRAPVLEATFELMHYHPEELDIEIQYTWNPPYIAFPGLCNVISEGTEYHLQPTMDSREHGGTKVTTEYFLGPGDGWLQWDSDREWFCGTVPSKIASQLGAERMEAYTIPLELTARVTKLFPGAMRFERILRCALPLTVKRRPDNCSSNVTKFGESPLLRAPLSRIQPCTPRYRAPRSPRFSCEDKENNLLSTKDLHKLMQRKAETPMRQAPLRLDSLSLARLHDAIALSNPPPSLTDVEIRAVHEVEDDSLWSDKENAGPVGSEHGARKTCRTVMLRETETGRTHAPLKGRIISSTDFEKIEFGAPSGVPAKLKSIKGQERTTETSRCDSINANSICYTCVVHGRIPERVDNKGLCASCEHVMAQGVPHRTASKPRTDWVSNATIGREDKTWQEEIQENWREFAAGRSDKLDITMEDVAESDAESPWESSDEALDLQTNSL